MSQLDPASSSLPIRPEHLQGHFENVLGIVKRVAPLRVGLYEHIYRGVYPDGWTIVFGRHRSRVRFHYMPRKGMTVQQADAPPSEWFPDWQHVKSESVDWSERQSSEYEAMEKVLFERFAA
jgi:hypothetical protein